MHGMGPQCGLVFEPGHVEVVCAAPTVAGTSVPAYVAEVVAACVRDGADATCPGLRCGETRSDGSVCIRFRTLCPRFAVRLAVLRQLLARGFAVTTSVELERVRGRPLTLVQAPDPHRDSRVAPPDVCCVQVDGDSELTLAEAPPDVEDLVEGAVRSAWPDQVSGHRHGRELRLRLQGRPWAPSPKNKARLSSARSVVCAMIAALADAGWQPCGNTDIDQGLVFARPAAFAARAATTAAAAAAAFGSDRYLFPSSAPNTIVLGSSVLEGEGGEGEDEDEDGGEDGDDADSGNGSSTGSSTGSSDCRSRSPPPNDLCCLDVNRHSRLRLTQSAPEELQAALKRTARAYGGPKGGLYRQLPDRGGLELRFRRRPFRRGSLGWSTKSRMDVLPFTCRLLKAFAAEGWAPHLAASLTQNRRSSTVVLRRGCERRASRHLAIGFVAPNLVRLCNAPPAVARAVHEMLTSLGATDAGLGFAWTEEAGPGAEGGPGLESVEDRTWRLGGRPFGRHSLPDPAAGFDVGRVVVLLLLELLPAHGWTHVLNQHLSAEGGKLYDGRWFVSGVHALFFRSTAYDRRRVPALPLPRYNDLMRVPDSEQLPAPRSECGSPPPYLTLVGPDAVDDTLLELFAATYV